MQYVQSTCLRREIHLAIVPDCALICKDKFQERNSAIANTKVLGGKEQVHNRQCRVRLETRSWIAILRLEYSKNFWGGETRRGEGCHSVCAHYCIRTQTVSSNYVTSSRKHHCRIIRTIWSLKLSQLSALIPMEHLIDRSCPLEASRSRPVIRLAPVHALQLGHKTVYSVASLQNRAGKPCLAQVRQRCIALTALNKSIKWAGFCTIFTKIHSISLVVKLLKYCSCRQSTVYTISVQTEKSELHVGSVKYDEAGHAQ